MSTTTLCIVDSDGDICDDSEYSNSWGFAAMIWDALLHRYHLKIPGLDPNKEPSGIFDAPKLWKADENDALPMRPWERNVLRATYDRAMIRGADLERMAESMEMFFEAHMKPGSACSLKAIAARLRELTLGGRSKVTRPDVCFIATSVAEDPWIVFDGDDDEDGRPYNVKRDSGHWFIELAATPPTQSGGTARKDPP